ncbi:thiolase C-terminal domain-containing protein [Pseudomonas sp. Pseusp97]|uniref:thiolase C-terminal domain-containing protein n=1 Tax=Pseudomonas sp. Pseusp97 TaxID=3243065 RepID=UPI0039A62CF9
MKSRVNVLGVGVTDFHRPGEGPGYLQLIADATRSALADAGLGYDRIGAAYVGYVFGESACGQHGLYGLGLTGIPIINVSNNGASGSTALYLAAQAIENGQADCVLAVGFEHMTRDDLSDRWRRQESPLERHLQVLGARQGTTDDLPFALQLYGGAAREYLWRYGARKETLAMLAVKAREHGSRNPQALFRQRLSLAEVLAAPMLFAPLTRPQCCAPACGGAAVVLCSESFARRHASARAVRLLAQALVTDLPSTFAGDSLIKAVGYDLAVSAARQVYEQACIGPADLDTCEIDDCFSAHEILLYEALGFCAEGDAERWVEDGDNTYGGNLVVNPSGGLLCRGHPFGATGLAQCAELVRQLREEGQQRQVEGARVALQHNLGLGSACYTAIYQRR